MFSQLILARASFLGAAIFVGAGLVAPVCPKADEVAANEVAAKTPNIVKGEEVDESALRYYASRNQTARVETEIKRLERLYPGWHAPDDLYTSAPLGGPDEQVFWDLFAVDRLDELQMAIDARRQSEPGWQPSADLMQKFQRKLARRKIMAMWKDGQWDNLVDFVKTNGAVDEGDLELAWTIAEAQAKVKQPAAAFAIYKSILNGKAGPEQRIATIHKAMATLHMAEVEPLIEMGKPLNGGHNEFDVILPDIARGRISAFLHNERDQEVAPADMKAFDDYALKSDDPNQSGLAAWYYYKRRDFREALTWFKMSIERGGDATIAHGMANALRDLGLLREAEEVSFAWREPLVNNAILFVDLLESQLTQEIPPYIEPERLARLSKVTTETASGEGAQALAWYAYNSCQFDVAAQWFQRALAWFPKETTAQGYALALQRSGKKKEALEIINRYDGLFPSVVGILFPDHQTRSPMPCESGRQATSEAAPPPNTFGSFGVGAPSQFIVAPAQGLFMDQRRARGFGAVPAPQAAIYGGPPPAINRNEFPLSVSPASPFRFVASRTTTSDRNAAPPAAVGLAYAREPFAGPWPLVASRVPGAGPMPYERYGFALLPGYNGVSVASWPPASAHITAVGTLWANEMAERMRTTSSQANPGAMGAVPNVQQPPLSGNAPNFLMRNR